MSQHRDKSSGRSPGHHLNGPGMATVIMEQISNMVTSQRTLAATRRDSLLKPLEGTSTADNLVMLVLDF